MPPTPVTLTFDLLTLKVVSESRVTWATFLPILVFLGLFVLDLGPIYATDVRQHHRLMPPPKGRGIINVDLYSAWKVYPRLSQSDPVAGVVMV